MLFGAGGKFSAALRVDGKRAAVPTAAQRLDQQDCAGQAAPEDVDREDLILKRGTLRHGDLEIAGDAASVAGQRELERFFGGFHGPLLRRRFLRSWTYI